MPALDPSDSIWLTQTPRRRWLAPALSAGLAMLLYVHTLGGMWIYDDLFHAHNDPRLSDYRLWGEYVTKGYRPDGADNLWRPLVSFSYAITWKVGGGRAWPFHLVNILLHAGASALVAELARRLGGGIKTAAIAGLLFAAHPVHVEGVAYIVGRAESMCAVGILGAMVLLLGPMSGARVAGIFGCFLVALLSKEQGLLLPFMLLALWKLRPRLIETGPGDARAGRMLLLLLVFTMAAYISYRNWILPWYWEISLLDYGTQPMIHSPARDRVLIPIALFGRAIALMAAPIKLSPEYGLAVIGPRQSMSDPYFYVGLIALMATVAVVWIAYRRRAWTVLFLLFCAGLSYGMVANIKLIGVVFAERLLYIPSAFLLILGAMAIARMPGKAMIPLLGLLLAGWGIRTATYAARWNDRLGFYKTSLAENPRAVRLHTLVARELMDGGDWSDARKTIDDAKAIAPDYWQLWMLSGWIAAEQRRFDAAEADLKKAWKLEPEIFALLAVESRLEELRATTRPASGP